MDRLKLISQLESERSAVRRIAADIYDGKVEGANSEEFYHGAAFGIGLALSIIERDDA